MEKGQTFPYLFRDRTSPCSYCKVAAATHAAKDTAPTAACTVPVGTCHAGVYGDFVQFLMIHIQTKRMEGMVWPAMPKREIWTIMHCAVSGEEYWLSQHRLLPVLPLAEKLPA